MTLHSYIPAVRQAPRPAPVTLQHLPYAGLARAAMLDRLADAEIQQGHHNAGERLSHLAREIRARVLESQP